jgi:hypothetical protein
MNVYRAITEPYFDYCCIIWDGISDYLALTGFKNFKIVQRVLLLEPTIREGPVIYETN